MPCQCVNGSSLETTKQTEDINVSSREFVFDCIYYILIVFPWTDDKMKRIYFIRFKCNRNLEKKVIRIIIHINSDWKSTSNWILLVFPTFVALLQNRGEIATVIKIAHSAIIFLYLYAYLITSNLMVSML